MLNPDVDGYTKTLNPWKINPWKKIRNACIK